MWPKKIKYIYTYPEYDSLYFFWKLKLTHVVALYNLRDKGLPEIIMMIPDLNSNRRPFAVSNKQIHINCN